MYEKRNNFSCFTVKSVRQEIENWIIIILYADGDVFFPEETHSMFSEHSVVKAALWGCVHRTVFIVPRRRDRFYTGLSGAIS